MNKYRANGYVLSKRLKQSALMVGSRMKSGREYQTVKPASEKAQRPWQLTLMCPVQTGWLSC